MPLAWIETPSARIRLESERLVVSLPDDGSGERPPEQLLPLAELERVVLSEQVHITTPALCALLERRIPVVFHTSNGFHLGAFLPPESRQAAVRLLQYQRSFEPDFTVGMSRILIQAKASNQRRLLQRLAASRKIPAEAPVSRISALLLSLPGAADLNNLRGLEGSVSALYWPAWGHYLPEAFPFGHRSTRPPHNPVNAVLSYLSTLLYGECLASCHRRGLDPAIGFLHPAQNGRWSLPLDLMEPFRAALAEPLTLRLFNHRILRQEHFEPRSGGIYLTAGGRRLLLGHYEKRLTARFLAEHSGTRTSLRDQIDATTLSFKAGLEDTRLFVPFTLN